MSSSRVPSASDALRSWSPSSTLTPMMPFSRKFSYASSSVFLIWPFFVRVTTNLPFSIFGTSTMAAIFSPASMPMKFTIARPLLVRAACGIS